MKLDTPDHSAVVGGDRISQMSVVPMFFLGCLACIEVHAGDALGEKSGATAFSSSGGFLVRSATAPALRETVRNTKPLRKPEANETPLAAAIARAAKKDFIDAGIEASRDMLIECQRETSVVLVTPSLRSNSQQDHCFRF